MIIISQETLTIVTSLKLLFLHIGIDGE